MLKIKINDFSHSALIYKNFYSFKLFKNVVGNLIPILYIYSSSVALLQQQSNCSLSFNHISTFFYWHYLH